MTNPLIGKLHALAAKFPDYAAGYEAHASVIVDRLEHWLTAVDAKIEDWASVALHDASTAAYKAYRDAVLAAHDRIDNLGHKL